VFRAAHRFGWEICGSSEACEWIAGCRGGRIARYGCCDAKVDHLWLTIDSDENIRWLQVAMDKSNCVCMSNSVSNVCDERDAFRDGLIT
jgi:hypothetical protein